MERQIQLLRQIDRFLDNFKKIGRNNYTPAVVRSRMRSLKEIWMQLTDGHAMLEKTIPESTRASVSYFSEHVYEDTEETYHATLDHMAGVLEELEPPVSPHLFESTYSRAPQNAFSISHLPSIQLPPFDGSVTEWESFRDRFAALIIENKDLSDFARMHFLVSFLRGRALECLADFTVTADNFPGAWRTLTDRYDNKRQLITAHLSTLLNLPRLSRESMSDLQNLRGRIKMTIVALNNLNRSPAELWNDHLVYVLTQSVDSSTRKAWNLRSGDSNALPTFDELDKFLASRIRALEDDSLHNPNKSTNRPVSRVHVATASTSARSPCSICKASHYFSACPTFARGSPEQRRDLVKKHRRCFNCLSQNHSAQECQSKYSCRRCQQRHHSLLHAASESRASAAADLSRPGRSEGSSNEVAEVHSMFASSNAKRHVPVLLATARVHVRSSCGRVVEARALLDQGSELTFLTENLAQVLRAKRHRMPVSVSAVGGVDAGKFNTAVNIIISSLSSPSPAFSTNAIILKTLTSYAPKRTIDALSLRHLSGLSWADPTPLNGDPIDLIIGAELYSELLCEGIRKGKPGQPVAQNTALGWIISGPLDASASIDSPVSSHDAHTSTRIAASVFHCTTSQTLDTELKRFWEIEDVPRVSIRTPEDTQCEEHFTSTHTRASDGRYIVRLPFKRDPPSDIGESRVRAQRCLASLLRRLHKNSDHYQAYCEFLREYEDLGHMKRARDSTDSSESNKIVFIPHHPVFRAHSLTTSLRVVFNASSPMSNGSSLNDQLLAGPKLQTELPAVILRWRKFKYAYSADIAKMYRQIIIDPRDTDYQRILWAKQPHEIPAEFQLLTVTYGMTCAPFLALRVLKQLALDEGDEFPLAVTVLRDNVYVDDVLFGGSQIPDVLQIRDQLTSLLRRGGFELRKWSSNSPALLSNIDDSNFGLACSKTLATDDTIKILGITWIPSVDEFQIGVSLPVSVPTSKRSILSAIAKLYDPLGWITPVTITAKIFMQHLWRSKIGWDDPIPPALLERWKTIYTGLSALDGLRIPRWTGLDDSMRRVELHGFADASNSAYSAVVYLKIISQSNHVTITLLAGRSKVAPLQPLSIPRLELSAAVLLARVIEFVGESLDLKSVPCYCWSDSTVTLTWLSQHPSRWKVFVANRVADVQTRIPAAHWRHVPSHDNPADCASRGLLGHEVLNHPLWWRGPAWLSNSASAWPPTRLDSTDYAASEEKTVALHLTEPLQSWDLISRFSSWPKLIRVIAYIQRFVFACRHGRRATPSGERPGRALTAMDCSRARTVLIKQVQMELFSSTLRVLTKKQSLPAKDPLLSLCPFLDRDGIIRVGGRISRAPLPFETRHPILLASHCLTKLIIDHAHLRALHAGIQLTLSIIRRDFWIIRARSLVRERIHQCISCVRERATMSTQLMSDLPKERVSAPTRSFTHCGLDYAGPVFVRASAGRGIVSRKAYIALFVCLATRAVHLELVVDYSTQAFLNAFSRFSARRGLPTTMYSDNGTNFVGAERELTAAYRAAIRDPNFQNRTATDAIEWKFIPPSAPHFGGIWEAGIKSVKHHVRQSLKEQTLTFEEFTTFLCRIEACLNSRPLAPLSDAPDDYDPLTPGHFLIGSALTAIPEPSLLNLNEKRLTRWQLVRQLSERFWRLWYADYVNSLQQRSKWRQVKPAIRTGSSS